MRWRFSSSRSAKVRRTDSTGDPEVMASSSICCLVGKPRFSLVPYSGMMLQATGCRSTIGESMAADRFGARFPDWPVHQQGKRGDDRNQELTVVPAVGNWPRCAISPKLHETIWSGAAAVTISAIHRVSLSIHDLAKAQQFFEAHLGLGRAVKVDGQTLAYGSGSRGLRIKKPQRLLT